MSDKLPACRRLAVKTQGFNREHQRQAGSLSDIAEFASRIEDACAPRLYF